MKIIPKLNKSDCMMIEGIDFISSNEILLLIFSSQIYYKRIEKFMDYLDKKIFDKKMRNIDYTWETIDTDAIYYICM